MIKLEEDAVYYDKVTKSKVKYTGKANYHGYIFIQIDPSTYFLGLRSSFSIGNIESRLVKIQNIIEIFAEKG